jgi:hypothetical protein
VRDPQKRKATFQRRLSSSFSFGSPGQLPKTVQPKKDLTVENVDTSAPDVNPSRLKPVLDFLQNKSESGEIPGPVASNSVTALRQLAAMLRDDEADDPEYVLEHLEELARRYGNKHPQNNQATTRTYVSRAKFGLEHYLGFQKDPLNYRFPPPKERPKREAKAAPRETKTSDAPASTTSETPSGYRRYPIPLGQGRPDLHVMIPDGEELFVNDVFRVTWALLVHAKDFDPRNPQVMSIVRHEGEQ